MDKKKKAVFISVIAIVVVLIIVGIIFQKLFSGAVS